MSMRLASPGRPKDSPLFRASNGRSRTLTGEAARQGAICELVKRRLKDAGLALRLSPHSFRVTAITAARAGGADGDVQYLAGNAEPRTTTLYDWRNKKVVRCIRRADSDLARAATIRPDHLAAPSKCKDRNANGHDEPLPGSVQRKVHRIREDVCLAAAFIPRLR